jgi:hypothetical protein
LPVKASQKRCFLICGGTLLQKAGLNGLKHVFDKKYFLQAENLDDQKYFEKSFPLG